MSDCFEQKNFQSSRTHSQSQNSTVHCSLSAVAWPPLVRCLPWAARYVNVILSVGKSHLCGGDRRQRRLYIRNVKIVDGNSTTSGPIICAGDLSDTCHLDTSRARESGIHDEISYKESVKIPGNFDLTYLERWEHCLSLTLVHSVLLYHSYWWHS